MNDISKLPINLKVEHIAEILGISRAGAYILVHQKGFPVIRIGKRLIIPRDAFIAWMENQINRS